MEGYIKKLNKISARDIREVGAKNAFLGEISTHLALRDIRIPEGFAITATAYRRFIEYNKLDGVHDRMLKASETDKRVTNKQLGEKLRALTANARMPGDICDSITSAYHELTSNQEAAVAVRSSPIIPDRFNITEKDQHEAFLNVKGEKELIGAVKKCFASLYSDKALKAGIHGGNKNAMAVAVQKMVRTDQACAGFAFTADPVSGFMDVIHVSGVWGLGEKMLEERITPDEFIVYKPTLPQGPKSIIQKKLGSKRRMLVYGGDQINNQVEEKLTPEELRTSFILNEDEILLLAKWGMILEGYYNSPMSIEWAKDGESQEIFLLQAKPKNFKEERRNQKLYDEI